MASARALAWLHRLIWTLIYGGLLALIIGLATQRTDDALGWSLVTAGAVLAAIGVFLIGVRSRLRESGTPTRQGTP